MFLGQVINMCAFYQFRSERHALAIQYHDDFNDEILKLLAYTKQIISQHSKLLGS
jgi:hypothetical protein